MNEIKTDFIGGFNITIKEERQELIDMVKDLLEIEKKNNKNQELVTKFSSECEEQQKNLDQIDLYAMEIEDWLRDCNEIPINVKNSISHWIKKIRGKI